MSLIKMLVNGDKWEELRELLKLEHEHTDGMNECSICDEPLVDAAIKELERLNSLVDYLRHCRECGCEMENFCQPCMESE